MDVYPRTQIYIIIADASKFVVKLAKHLRVATRSPDPFEIILI